VPEGKARIRTIVTSEHTRGQMDEALDKFIGVGKEMSIL